MSSRPTRAAAKSTPFSAAAAAAVGGNGNGNGSTRSHLQRSAMTASLRKAKRGQTVARKRHMRLMPSSPTSGGGGGGSISASSSPSAGGTQMMEDNTTNNPYDRDAAHVRETIEIATSIVVLVVARSSAPTTAGHDGSSSPMELSSLLDRLCVLLTPVDDDAEADDNAMTTAMSASSSSSATTINAPTNRGRSPPPPPQTQPKKKAGASYDSSTAGMAANSLLTQFVEEGKLLLPRREENNTNNLAFLLADALALVLGGSGGATTTTTIGRSDRIRAAIAMNQLAATEPPPPVASSLDQEEFSPYGHPPRLPSALKNIPASWCHVLVRSRALAALVHHIPSSDEPDPDDIELCEKCIWAVGNLAGDSETAREALRASGGALPRLIGCLAWAVSAIRHRHPDVLRSISLTDLVRNCVWTLCNLIREGTIPASEFLDMPSSGGGTWGSMEKKKLTSTDVAMLLSAPEAFPPPPPPSSSTSSVDGYGAVNKATTATTTTTWNEVAVETCWLVSFLARDAAAVDFFCSDRDGVDGGAVVISALVSRLAHATEATGRRLNDLGDNDPSWLVRDAGPLIPCCRSLRNIAVASDFIHVQSILLAKPLDDAVGGQRRDDEEAGQVELSLARLISLGSLGAGNELSAIATEAAATAGACLYVAGLPVPQSPPTRACRVLLPALCQAMVYQLSTFEFRREVAWAMWSVVDLPPEIRMRDDARAVQRDLLGEVIYTLPSGMAGALTTMLSSLDSSALEASLRLIDALLRRLDDGSGSNEQLGGKKLSTLFEEVGLVDALWRICDNDSEESATAELAAEILDDFYEIDEEDELEESLQPASVGGQFQFQTPSAPEGGFNFGSTGEFNFGATAPLRHDQHLPPMGRGRGRGQVLPAWMQQQQPQPNGFAKYE